MSIQLSEAAAQHIQHIIARRGSGVGLRLGIKSSGCANYSYVMDVAQSVDADDAVFESHGTQIVVKTKDLPVLDGTTIDYKTEGLNKSLVFDNPHVENTCGCGVSFTVKNEE